MLVNEQVQKGKREGEDQFLRDRETIEIDSLGSYS